MANTNGVMQNGKMVFSTEVRIERTATKSGRKYQQWVFVGWSPLPIDLTGEKAYMKGKYLMVEWANGEVERWEVGEDFDLSTIKQEPTLDYYCMECGESQSPKVKKCEYCGSREIDVMEIEPEVEEPAVSAAQDAPAAQVDVVEEQEAAEGTIEAFKLYDKTTNKMKTFKTHDEMVNFSREKKILWPVYLKLKAEPDDSCAEIMAFDGENYNIEADLYAHKHDDGRLTFGFTPDGCNGLSGFKKVNDCLKAFCKEMIEQAQADKDDYSGCRCGGGGCVNCRPRDYIDGWIY